VGSGKDKKHEEETMFEGSKGHGVKLLLLYLVCL